MADLDDGESVEMQGSGSTPYVLRNDGGVYSCSCPAWRHQSLPIDQRTCKHLRKLRGDQAELDRIGSDAPPIRAPKPRSPKAASAGGDGDDAGGSSDGKGPPVLLAERWDPGQHDPTGWWSSEKLDGVRAYWDGQQFLSRLGNRFLAPAWFVEGLPDHPLDGELWGGRKRFQETVSTVRRASGGDRWKELAFVVFDAPAHDGPFEDRIATASTVLSERAPYARTLEQVACRGIDHLKDELARVEALGGEGLMLRRPGSRYEVGRSSTLLKVKNFYDAEAVVIGHVAGAGKHRGRLGSLLVETAEGVKFNVGTGFSDAERGDPPPIGALITYRYQELTKDRVPRFPSYVGIRIDAAAPARLAVRASNPGRPTQPATASAPTAAAPAPAKATATPAPARAPAKPPATAAPKPTPAGSTPKAASAAKAEPNVGVGMARRFEFEEGTSSKFWEVSQAGSAFTVTYGRIGSSGQSKTKQLGSAGAAASEVAKLIAEKTGKGYVEITAPGSRPADDDDDDDDLDELDDLDEVEPEPDDDATEALRGVIREIRPLVAKVRARIRKDYPEGLPPGLLAELGLDEEEIEDLGEFVAGLGEVVQVLARFD
ncbi:MAG: DNA ligase [Myxococcota bacterium]